MKISVRQIKNFLLKYWWETLLVLLSGIGIILGIIGFAKCPIHDSSLNGLYNTFRMFLLSHEFKKINCFLEASRWLIFFAFLLISFKLFVTIVAPKFFQYIKIRCCFNNHIIICGLTEESLLVANKYVDKQRIFIDNDLNNPLHRSIRARNARLIVGEPSSRTILKYAKISHAEEIFIFTGNDVQNVKNAQTIYEISKNNRHNREPLKCYVNIRDLSYRRMLNDITLFSTLFPTFDGRPFNIEESGVRLGLLEYAQRIFNSSQIHFLIAGLNQASICFLENFGHFFNPYNHLSKIKVTIVENEQSYIDTFTATHSFLEHFYEFEFVNKNILTISKNGMIEIMPTCCIIDCNSLQEMKVAMHLWRALKNGNIPILVLSNDTHNSSEIFPLHERNVTVINLPNVKYSFHQKFFMDIEGIARKCHELYNETLKKNNPNATITEYDDLTEHFKDSNRYQAIDTFYKLFFIGVLQYDSSNEKFIPARTILTLNEEKLLSHLEHRRWMIEKSLDGWTYGKEKSTKRKENPCFIVWDNLSEEEKRKDDNIIEIAKIILEKESHNV